MRLAGATALVAAIAVLGGCDDQAALEADLAYRIKTRDFGSRPAPDALRDLEADRGEPDLRRDLRPDTRRPELPKDTQAPEIDPPEMDAPVVPTGEVVVLFDDLVDPLQPILIDVPENVIAITVTIDGERWTTYSIAYWTDPEGLELVPEGWTDGQFLWECNGCLNPVLPLYGAVGNLVPNNPSSRALPGVHELAIIAQGFAQPPPRVLIHARTEPEEPSTGMIDVNFYFTGAIGWTAASAPSDPEFDRFVLDAFSILRQGDVVLNQRRYIDIEAVFEDIETLDELVSLFESSAGGPSDGLNVFLVGNLEGELGGALGVAGGIPGPVLLQGTEQSGVVVALEPTTIEDSSLTLAHELGHYLGLFHSTEADAINHDPLTDTPRDDSLNFMYWASMGSVVSPQQGAVMRRNPWCVNPQ